NPPVLILDDALSSVDSHTEKAILENLKDYFRERNTIIISHRISAIKESDWIYVMDNGEIVEQGKHDDLLRKEGLYYLLYQRQKLEEALGGE
ncbi:MAG: ABC transporter ATP-binding protein, partial [Candidatus Latescibacterota bacterium]